MTRSESFGDDIDYAMLVKLYGSEAEGPPNSRRGNTAPAIAPGRARATPSQATRPQARQHQLRRTPKFDHENADAARFTRLTNAFSKKVANHEAAVALHFMHYNFVRIHQTLGVTPAIAAGVTGRLWSIEDIAQLLD